MAITRDFECMAHGVFESVELTPKCPKGCSKKFVKLVHLQAPGHIGAKTKNADRIFKDVAKQAGLTDMRNDKEGGSVMDHMRNKPSNQSRWMQPGKSLDLGAFGMREGQNNIKGLAVPRVSPGFIARDPQEYRGK